jgi:hypothetical protein
MKRGEMTVAKLVTIVLAVVVLALVVYGFTTGGINPLIKKMGVMADDVLILLNMKDDDISNKCYFREVGDLSGGEKFLKDLGKEGEDVILNVCKGGICNVSGKGLGDYRFSENGFEEFVGGEWKKYKGVFVGDLAEIKLHHEIYREGNKALVDAKAVEFYKKISTGKFSLWGDGNGWLDSPSSAIWENGVWTVVVSGDDPIEIEDDTIAIDRFMEGANDKYYHDSVYWKIDFLDNSLSMGGGVDGSGGSYDNFLWKPDEGTSLIQRSGYSNSISFKEDKDKLKVAFKEKKKELLSKTMFSMEDFINFENEIGKIGGFFEDREVGVGIDDTGEFPVVEFFMEGGNLGLSPNYENAKDPTECSFSFSLVERSGDKWEKIGNEDYYKLEEDKFDGRYEATVISRFLESKCKG